MMYGKAFPGCMGKALTMHGKASHSILNLRGSKNPEGLKNSSLTFFSPVFFYSPPLEGLGEATKNPVLWIRQNGALKTNN
jgi:hypothetical protein